MKEIGELLREAREQKGKSLEEISRETKIQKKYLSLIEEGDFSSFPGEVYVKGALRNFAEAVDLDPKEVISLYNQSISYKKKIEEKPEKEEKKRSSPVIGKEKKPFPLAALLWILLLVFIVGGSLWYHYQHRGREENLYPPKAFPEEGKEPGSSDNHEIFPIEEPEPVAESKLTLLSSTDREIIYVLSGAEEKNISLSFTGSCWLQIKQDGRLIEEKTYRAGEKVNFGDCGETWLRLGNPPVVKIKVNEFEISDVDNYTHPVNITIRKER